MAYLLSLCFLCYLLFKDCSFFFVPSVPPWFVSPWSMTWFYERVGRSSGRSY